MARAPGDKRRQYETKIPPLHKLCPAELSTYTSWPDLSERGIGESRGNRENGPGGNRGIDKRGIKKLARGGIGESKRGIGESKKWPGGIGESVRGIGESEK